jgi:hypothetical protein
MYVAISIPLSRSFDRRFSSRHGDSDRLSARARRPTARLIGRRCENRRRVDEGAHRTTSLRWSRLRLESYIAAFAVRNGSALSGTQKPHSPRFALQIQIPPGNSGLTRRPSAWAPRLRAPTRFSDRIQRREPLKTPAPRHELYSYIAGIVQGQGGVIFGIKGTTFVRGRFKRSSWSF